MRNTVFALVFILPLLLAAQKPELVVPIGHYESVEDVAFSPDGRYTLTASEDKTTKLWDTETGLLIHSFQDSASVHSAVFSPDGRQFITSNGNLWEVQSGQIVQTFEIPWDVYSFDQTPVVFSPDGQTILSGRKGICTLWDVASGDSIRSYTGLEKAMEDVAFSPDGRYIFATTSFSGKIWERNSGRVHRSFEAHQGWGKVSSVAFSPNGQHLFTGGTDQIARSWNLRDEKPIRSFKGLQEASYSPDGRFVLTLGWKQNLVKLTDVASGQIIHSFPANEGKVIYLGFSPDNQFVLTGEYIDDYAFLKIRRRESGELIHTLPLHRLAEEVNSIAFSPDGQYVTISTEDDELEDTAEIWNLSSGRLLGYFEAHPAPVFSEDSKFLLAENEDLAGLWNIQGDTLSLALEMSWSVSNFGFSSDRKFIIASEYSRKTQKYLISIWNRTTSELVFLSEEDISNVRISPSSRYFLSQLQDGTIQIRAANSGEVLHIFPKKAPKPSSLVDEYVLSFHGDTVRIWSAESAELVQIVLARSQVSSGATILSPDQKYLLIKDDENNRVDLWEVSSGKHLRIFNNFNGDIGFSKDGQQILQFGKEITFNLWDLNTGQLTRSFTGYGSIFGSQKVPVAFSPNGQFLIAGRFVWSARTGEQLFSLEGGQKYITSVAFSPDNNYILTGSNDGSALLWDLKTGQWQQSFTGKNDPPRTLFLSPDGGHLLVESPWGKPAATKLWDLNKGRITRFFTGITRTPSPDWRFLVNEVPVSGRSEMDSIQLYDFVTGEMVLKKVVQPYSRTQPLPPDGSLLLYPYSSPSWSHGLLEEQTNIWSYPSGETILSIDSLQSIIPSSKGRYVLGKLYAGPLNLWDLKSLQKIELDIPETRIIRAAAFSPDEKFLALVTHTRIETDNTTDFEDIVIGLWSTGKEKPLRLFPEQKYIATSISFSPDSKKLVSTTVGNGEICLWNTATGEIISQFKSAKDYRAYKAVFSKNGKNILITSTEAHWEGSLQHISMVDVASEKTIHSLGEVSRTFFSENEEWILIISIRNEVQLWNTQTGKIHVIDLSTRDFETLYYTYSIVISPDGKHIMASYRDHTVKIWDTQNGEIKATLFQIDAIDWVVTTPAGLYDASPGAAALMHYVVNYEGHWEVIELEQLKDRYYEPDLLKKLMGNLGNGLRSVEEIDQQGLALYPLIEQATIEGDSLKVRLRERNGGIGRVALFMGEEFEIFDDINPKRQTEFTVDLSGAALANHFPRDTAYQISLQVYNREPDGREWLKSRFHPLEYRPTGVSSKGGGFSRRKQKDADLESQGLYALVVGTSTYNRDTSLSLRYPDKDATAFAAALEQAGRALFRDQVEIKLLTTRQEPWPRKDQIKDALREFAERAGPEDILLVYFSGHGVTYPPQSELGRFYYLTTDIPGDKLDDPAILNSMAIAQDSLQKWIQPIAAKKRILILDACSSGKVLEQFTLGDKEKNLNPDQRRALERMKGRSGMYVLAGSAADKSSYEATRYGHGLLTYSLLNNMIKVARSDDYAYVNVNRLFEEVREEVPRLAKNIGRTQDPDLIGGDAYPIGIINGEVQIEVPQEKAVFVRTNFQNNRRRDFLRLSPTMDRLINQLSTEKEQPFVFWDVRDIPDDYFYLGGVYREEGDQVFLTAELWLKEDQLTTFGLSGSKTNLEDLGIRLIERVMAYLRAQGVKGF